MKYFLQQLVKRGIHLIIRLRLICNSECESEFMQRIFQCHWSPKSTVIVILTCLFRENTIEWFYLKSCQLNEIFKLNFVYQQLEKSVQGRTFDLVEQTCQLKT